MMPGMDGLATMREIRRRPLLADIPIIFLTAKVQPNEVAAYRAMGAAGVIAKPFDVEKLCPEIASIWRGRGSNR
jgi:CheY-like chemotaxis protein